MKRLLFIIALLSVNISNATSAATTRQEEINGIYKVQLKYTKDGQDNLVALGEAYMTQSLIKAIKDAKQDEGIKIISKAMDIADYKNKLITLSLWSLLNQKALSDNDFKKLIKDFGIEPLPEEVLSKISEFAPEIPLNDKVEREFNPRKSSMRYDLQLKELKQEGSIVTIPCTAKQVEFEVRDIKIEMVERTPTAMRFMGQFDKIALIKSTQGLGYDLKAKIRLTTLNTPSDPSINLPEGYYSDAELPNIVQSSRIQNIAINDLEIRYLVEQRFDNLPRVIQRAKTLATSIKVDISVAVDLLTRLSFLGYLNDFNDSQKLLGIRKIKDKDYSFDFKFFGNRGPDQSKYPVLSIYFTKESMDEQSLSFSEITDQTLLGSVITRIKVGDKEFIPPVRRAFKKEDIKTIYNAFVGYISNLEMRLDPVDTISGDILYDEINLNDAFGPLFPVGG